MTERFQPPDARAGAEQAAVTYEPGATASAQSGVAAARHRHEASLMAIDGVKGVAIGRDPIGNDAIVVYLEHEGVKSRIAAEIDGYPVETVVVGEIDAYGAGPG